MHNVHVGGLIEGRQASSYLLRASFTSVPGAQDQLMQCRFRQWLQCVRYELRELCSAEYSCKYRRLATFGQADENGQYHVTIGVGNFTLRRLIRLLGHMHKREKSILPWSCSAVQHE